MLIIMMVAVPILLGYLLYRIWPVRSEDRRSVLEVGDPIIYRVQKVSPHPGLRARSVHPAQRGDTYCYMVDKFWTVGDVLRDGRIVAVTRTNKRRFLRPDDRNLRRAGLVERLRFRRRFPQLASAR